MVMPLAKAQIGPAVQMAAQLRNAGFSTMLYTEPDEPKKKFRYADRMGFPWIVIIGEREVASGVAEVKNMNSGKSTSVPIANLVNFLKQS
jgi:histidyl-tRNA synthetase